MKPNPALRTLLVVLVLGSTGLSSVFGEDQPAETKFSPWDRGALRFGGFAAALDSTMAFGLGGGAGVNLDAEELLGLDSSLTVFRVDALYRIGESRRHRLDFTFVSLRRSADETLTEEIDVDGEVLVPGTQIESVFDVDLYRLSYTYSFFQDERINLGGGLGVYIAPVRYGIDITSPGDDRTLDVRNVTLPLPALSLRGDAKLTRKLSIYGEIDFMYLEMGGYAGSLLDLRLGVEYQFVKHFGVGVGYNSFDVDVEAEGSSSDYPSVDFVGAINMRFSGLMLYGKLSF